MTTILKVIEKRMERAKAELDLTKERLSHAREMKIDYKIKIESDNIRFWDGYLTALEELEEEFKI